MRGTKWLVTGLFLVWFFSPECFSESQVKSPRSSEDTTEGSENRVESRSRVIIGGISLFGDYSSPIFYEDADPNRPLYWSPFWRDYWFNQYRLPPLVYPGWHYGFSPEPNMGQVKLTVEPTMAEVFLNGAYAGVARDLETIWLQPGAYDLTIETLNRTFRRRIYVLSGKTLRVNADLTQETEQNRR